MQAVRPAGAAALWAPGRGHSSSPPGPTQPQKRWRPSSPGHAAGAVAARPRGQRTLRRGRLCVRQIPPPSQQDPTWGYYRPGTRLCCSSLFWTLHHRGTSGVWNPHTTAPVAVGSGGTGGGPGGVVGGAEGERGALFPHQREALHRAHSLLLHLDERQLAQESWSGLRMGGGQLPLPPLSHPRGIPRVSRTRRGPPGGHPGRRGTPTVTTGGCTLGGAEGDFVVPSPELRKVAERKRQCSGGRGRQFLGWE